MDKNVEKTLFACCGSVALEFAWCKVAQADLLVRGYSAGTANFYDRFNNSPQFIGNPFDWSGIGRSAGGRWGTMVSANYFLSAAHFAPGAGETLTFYGTNDLNGPSQTVNIVSVSKSLARIYIWDGLTSLRTLQPTVLYHRPMSLDMTSSCLANWVLPTWKCA